jgi:heat shock protein HslJ
MKWIGLWMMVAGLMACQGGKESADDLHDLNRVLGQEWQLIELNGKVVSAFQLPHLLIVEGTVPRITGFAGCNRFSGNCLIKREGSLRIGPLMATQMACTDLTLEQNFLHVLEQANAWQYNDASLFLFNNEVPLARLVAKSAAEQLQTNPVNTSSGTWILTMMPETDLPINVLFPEKRPELIVAAGDSTLQGFGGCNHFSANVVIRDSMITVTGIRSTRMYCEGNGESVFWDRLLQANWLQQPDRDQLQLWKGNQLLLQFKRK